MLCLWQKDGLTQKELVAQVGIEQATMANTLARMERDGLIQRLADPDDGRIRRNWLSEKGRALQAPAIEAAMAENDAGLAQFTQQERDTLVALMRKAITSYGW